MNWKKWDENNWVNVDNGHIIEVTEELNCGYYKTEASNCVYYRVPGLQYHVLKRAHKTRAEAEEFIKKLILIRNYLDDKGNITKI